MASNPLTPRNKFQDNSPTIGQLQSSETSLTPPTLINPGVSPSNLQVFGSDTVEAMRQQGSSRQRQNRSFNLTKMSIRTKATLLAIALGSMPLVVSGGLAYLQISKSVDQQSATTKQARGVALSRRTNLFLKERYGDIQVLSELPALANPKVREVMSSSEQTKLLENYLKSYGVYDGLAVADVNGKILAQTTIDPLPDMKGRDYFEAVLATGKPAITYRKSTVTGKLSIFMAGPIRDTMSRQIIGVVRTRLPIEAITNALQDLASNGDAIYLIDKQGKFLLANSGKTTEIANPLVGEAAESLYPGIGVEISARKISSRFLTDKNGDEKFLTIVPEVTVEGFPPQDFTAVITSPIQIANAPKQELLLVLEISAAVALLGITSLAVVLVNRAIRPLLEASTAVASIGQGNLQTRLFTTQDGDELNQLGQNINRMAEQLQSLVGQQEAEARQAMTLATIARASRDQDLNEPLGQLIQDLRQTLKGDRVLLYRLQDSGFGTVLAEDLAPGQSSLRGQQGLPMLSEDQVRAYSNGQTTLIRQLDRAEPLPDSTELFFQPLTPDQIQYHQQWGAKSLLMAPIMANNALYGMIIVHQSDRRDWMPPEVEYVTQVSNQLGLALTGLLSLQQEQSRATLERSQKESIQRELLGLLSEVEGASSGDLTVRAQISDGEIGIVADFFNAIVESLRDIVTQVKETSAQVNASVSANDLSVRKLATDATEQSFQVTETLQSVDNMATSLQDIATKATQAARSSQKAARTAQVGGQAMEKTVASITQVREAVAETAKKVKRLGESSQQISKVIELINQIALKTNLLAVNAGIEAARAGEEGRGFAVVAEEVGALAAQSAQATKEIEQIVEAIQQETSQVVEAMEASTSQVVDGTRYVEEAKFSLGQIMQVSNQVNQVFQAISIATGDQVQTSNLVKQLMERVATISRQTSVSSQEVSESLQATVAMTHELQASVGAFKVDN